MTTKDTHHDAPAHATHAVAAHPKPQTVESLSAENADLRARLSKYEVVEPEVPKPIVEYPKWIRKKDAKGHVVDERLVQNKAEEDKAGAGWE